MFLDEIKIGEKIEIAPAVVEEEEMLAFSRRFNNIPVHTDAEYAKTTKFGAALFVNMFQYKTLSTRHS